MRRGEGTVFSSFPLESDPSLDNTVLSPTRLVTIARIQSVGRAIRSALKAFSAVRTPFAASDRALAPFLEESLYVSSKAFVQPVADSSPLPCALLLSSGFLIIPDLAVW